MLETFQDWNRTEAEKRVDEVLDAAKSGRVQRIRDADGVFEVKFRSIRGKPAGDFLARGGPGVE